MRVQKYMVPIYRTSSCRCTRLPLAQQLSYKRTPHTLTMVNAHKETFCLRLCKANHCCVHSVSPIIIYAISTQSRFYRRGELYDKKSKKKKKYIDNCRNVTRVARGGKKEQYVRFKRSRDMISNCILIRNYECLIAVGKQLV